MTTARVGFFIVFGCDVSPHDTPGRVSVRVTKSKPSTAANEVAMEVECDLPVSLFKKPTLRAQISIPDGQSAPLAITPELQTNIAAVLQERFEGLRFELSVPTP